MKLLIQPLYLIHSHHLSMFHGRFARHLFVYLPLFLKEEGEPQNDLTLCGGSITFIKKIVYIKKKTHLCVLLLHNLYSVSIQLYLRILDKARLKSASLIMSCLLYMNKVSFILIILLLVGVSPMT